MTTTVREYYGYAELNITVKGESDYIVIVEQSTNRKSYVMQESFCIEYRKKGVQILYIAGSDQEMSPSELERYAKKAIDIHVYYLEAVPVLLRLMTIRPDMKDSWRELRKYLT